MLELDLALQHSTASGEVYGIRTSWPILLLLRLLLFIKGVVR